MSEKCFFVDQVANFHRKRVGNWPKINYAQSTEKENNYSTLRKFVILCSETKNMSNDDSIFFCFYSEVQKVSLRATKTIQNF